MNTEAKTTSVTAQNAGYLANFTIEDLFQRNIHYGHVKNLWNPKMAPYIHSVKNNVHIINLAKTYEALSTAKSELYKAGLSHKRVLFVGTKPQISKYVKQYAIECGQYYVNHKWLGGMLTNWKVINTLVKTLQKYEKMVQKNSSEYTKKELFLITKKIEKLEKSIGGIKDLPAKPDILFVIDTELEKMAIKEANKLGIKVIAVVDTNSNPEGVDIVIPGNDDSIKAIEFYLSQASESVLAGIKKGLLSSGVQKPAEKKPQNKEKKA
jgi:small subunit ribosomal protein S2